MVACLLSRDWKNRETGLKYMSRKVTKVLNERRTTNSYQETRWNVLDVCCTVLKHMSGDPVYNVYVGALVCISTFSAYRPKAYMYIIGLNWPQIHILHLIVTFHLDSSPPPPPPGNNVLEKGVQVFNPYLIFIPIS